MPEDKLGPLGLNTSLINGPASYDSETNKTDFNPNNNTNQTFNGLLGVLYHEGGHSQSANTQPTNAIEAAAKANDTPKKTLSDNTPTPKETYAPYNDLNPIPYLQNLSEQRNMERQQAIKEIDATRRGLK